VGVHFHVTLLVNSKTLWQSALKMTVEDHERPTDALNETSSQRLESGARRINQQSLMWPGPTRPIKLELQGSKGMCPACQTHYVRVNGSFQPLDVSANGID
jgi:hypothetical protein